MAGLSEEEIKSLLDIQFDLKPYYSDGRINNFNPDTGAPISEDEKKEISHIIQMITVAAKTDIGKDLLSQLNPDIKVQIFVDSTRKNESNGWNNDNHQIAITNTEKAPEINAITFLHELTHEVQRQQGGDSFYLATEQDRFMTNKMMEAEARLTAAKATSQISDLLAGKEYDDFMSHVDTQTLKDTTLYLKLRYENHTPEDQINKTMLGDFYRDIGWNEAYSQQALGAVNYQLSLGMYNAQKSQDVNKVRMTYMRRMGLGEEEANFFFNPQNIVNYPEDQILRKSEESISVLDTDKKITIVKEDGKECQKITTDSNGTILLEERFLDKNTTCMKTYDSDGHPDKSAITTQSYLLKTKKVIDEKNNQFICSIQYEGSQIVSIIDPEGNQLMSAQEVAAQKELVEKSFDKLMSGEKLDDQTLANVSQILLSDKYGIYLEATATKEKFKQAIIQRISSTNSFQSPELKNQFKGLYETIIKQNPKLIDKDTRKKIEGNFTPSASLNETSLNKDNDIQNSHQEEGEKNSQIAIRLHQMLKASSKAISTEIRNSPKGKNNSVSQNRNLMILKQSQH